MNVNDLRTSLRESAVADDLDRFRDLLSRAEAHPPFWPIAELRAACDVGSYNVVRYLVKKRKTPVPQDLIFRAYSGPASKGDAELLRILIPHCDNFQVDKTDLGYTLLHVACRHGWLGVVRLLVEDYGANVLSTNYFGETPLHYAARQGRLKLVKYLVENSPAEAFNVDVVSKNGKTPLHESCYAGKIKVARYLVEDCNANTQMKYCEGGTSLLHCAVVSNNLAMVQYVMESCNGSTFIQSKTSGYGRTPLHNNAAKSRRGNAEIARYLVQHGANVHERDSQGMNALHLASSAGLLELVQYLVQERNSNVEQASRNGWTALFYASYNCRSDVIRYLVEECGANTKVADKFGRTPLRRPKKYRYKHDPDSVPGFQRVAKYLHSVTLPLAVPVQAEDMSEPSVRLNPHLCVQHRVVAEKTFELMTDVMGIRMDRDTHDIVYNVMGYLTPAHVSLRSEYQWDENIE